MESLVANICRNAGLSAAEELNEALNKALGGLDKHAEERIDQMDGVLEARITQVGDAFAVNATHLGERVEQVAVRTERALVRSAREFATVTNQTLQTADAVATNAVSSFRTLERDIARDASQLIDFAMAQIRWTLWSGMVYVLIVLCHVFVVPPLLFTVCSICITALTNVLLGPPYRMVESKQEPYLPPLPPLPRSIAQLN